MRCQGKDWKASLSFQRQYALCQFPQGSVAERDGGVKALLNLSPLLFPEQRHEEDETIIRDLHQSLNVGVVCLAASLGS